MGGKLLLLSFITRDMHSALPFPPTMHEDETSKGGQMLAQATYGLGTGRRALSFVLPSEVVGTISAPPPPHQPSMVDLWQPAKGTATGPAQTGTSGWETKLESAGGRSQPDHTDG